MFLIIGGWVERIFYVGLFNYKGSYSNICVMVLFGG